MSLPKTTPKLRNGTVRFPDIKNPILPTYVRPKGKKMTPEELAKLRADAKHAKIKSKKKNINNK